MGLTKTFPDGTTPSVAIIGAGFSGLCAAIRLQTQLDLTTYQIFELEPDLGGTWWSNTYPGAGCDIPSICYQFSFEPNYEWSRRFSLQDEILAYMKRVAEKHKVVDKIRFRTEVTHLEWNQDRKKWVLEYQNLSSGEHGSVEVDVVFSGTGPLRIPKVPKQFEDFEGPKWHTAQWNHAYDLTDKRVAIVGSGASAIQVIPAIVDKVKSLEAYQRSASYVVPRQNGAYGPVWKFLFRHVPFFHFVYFKLCYWDLENLIGVFSHDFLHKFTRAVITVVTKTQRWWQIRDKALRKKLTPNYTIGCRRVVVSSEFYPAMAKKNVSVHTQEIASVKGNTLTLKDGSKQEVDALILATGFNTQQFVPPKFLVGLNHVDLHEKWGQNPSTFYGLTSSDTPNLFFLLGPNTTLGHNSVVFMIESQVEYAIKALSHMMKDNLSSFVVSSKACDEFTKELDQMMERRVWTTSCTSWYKNEQGRITSLWWGTCSQYASKLRHFHTENFLFTKRA